MFPSGLGPAAAQGWPPWADDSFGSRRWGYERRPSWDGYDPVEPRERRALTPKGGDIRDGGGRPEIAPQTPAVVTFLHDYPLNSIVIDTSNRKLYYVLPDSRAYEYAISVGREGFNWTGSETVSRKQAWPDWHPPTEMRERDPALPERMSGGLRNPLGAMALYLGETLYRIHGNERREIDRPGGFIGVFPHAECACAPPCLYHRDRDNSECGGILAAPAGSQPSS